MSTEIPGSGGLPLLGETLGFLGGPYAFLQERKERHGNVFRTHLLGKPCVVLTGPAAAEAFIDPSKVQREGSQPANIFSLFAGPSVPHLDGEEHRERKMILMQAFTREALTSYVPAMQSLLESSFERWASGGEFRWMEELQRLSVESVCGSFLGESSGPRVEQLRAHYRTIDQAFTGVPVKLPGGAYAKGLAALEKILAIFHEYLREHRSAAKDDGLARMLSYSTSKGTKLNDDQAAREMHHMIIAGRIVWAHLATLLLELDRHADVRTALEEEVKKLAPSGALSVEQLYAMPYLKSVVLEVKRVSPVVPGVFGLAKEDFTVEGHTIQKGWMLLLALRTSHQLGSVYEQPERFDPKRMGEERAEHEKNPHGFFPHGPGKFLTSHHCAGTDYATILTQAFAIVLCRKYRYELPPQDLEYRWNQLTPEPKDGLRAKVFKR